MPPKHEYGENVANNDDQGFEYGSKQNYNNGSIVHDSSFKLTWLLTESIALFLVYDAEFSLIGLQSGELCIPVDVSVLTCRSTYCTTDVFSVGVVVFVTQQDKMKTSRQNKIHSTNSNRITRCNFKFAPGKTFCLRNLISDFFNFLHAAVVIVLQN